MSLVNLTWSMDTVVDSFNIYRTTSPMDINNLPTSVNTGVSTINFPAGASWSYYPMRGYMSDLAFFDKALTQQQVEALYTLGKI